MATTDWRRQLLAVLFLVALPGLSLQACPKVNDTLIRQKRIEAFTVQVLSKLGYTGGKPPNPDKPVNFADIDPEIRRMYHRAETMTLKHNSHCPMRGDPSNFDAKRVQSVPGNMKQINGQLNTEFLLITKDNSVAGVEVDMDFTQNKRTRRQQAAPTPPHATVDIYLKELDASNNTVRRELLYSKVYRQEQLTSLRVDITSLMELHWDELVSAAYAMIEVEIDSADELSVDPEAPPSLLMFTSLEDPAEERQRRQTSLEADADYCLANPTETRCCVKSLVINFHSDLNWKWILWPRNVRINYCAGLCPYTWPTTTERYPKVLRQYRYLNPTAAAEPCCSAQRLQSIIAIVQEAPEKRPTIMMLSDMVVESCVCG